MRLPAALVLAALVLPGCVDTIEDRFRASDVQAPRWDKGDWWTYRITSDAYGTNASVTIVVADVNGTTYLLGTPAGEAPLDAMLFHMPPIGPVRDDLAWDVHGTRFEPMQWPLEDGKEWDTTWITAEVRLTARLENGTWNVTNEGFEDLAGGMSYELRYEPAQEWFTSFTRTSAAGVVQQRIELVERGIGWSGDVRAPAYVDVAFLESRASAVLSQGFPAPPNPTFTPPEGVDTLLVGCIGGGAPGAYHAEVRSPTGVVCTIDVTLPPGDSSLRNEIVEVATEGGSWEARLFAGGQGRATAEVLAYPLRTITLE